MAGRQTVLVASTAEQTARALVSAAQQFTTAVSRLTGSAAALSNQQTWSGATADRFRVEEQALAVHLRAMSASVQRMADAVLNVIETIDNDDARGMTGVRAVPAGSVNAGPVGNFPLAGIPMTAATTGELEPGFRIGTDLGMILGGLTLIVLGAGGEILGVGLDATGIGVTFGVPTGLVSTGVIMTGAGLVIRGAQDLGQTVLEMAKKNSGDPGQPKQRATPAPKRTNAEIAAQAKKLGYGQRIPPQKARGMGIDSHGQPVFTNGKDYISPDIDQHNSSGWKRFDGKGQRTGTWDWDLKQRLKN